MKAAVIHEHGGLDLVRVEEVPAPKAAEARLCWRFVRRR